MFTQVARVLHVASDHIDVTLGECHHGVEVAQQGPLSGEVTHNRAVLSSRGVSLPEGGESHLKSGDSPALVGTWQPYVKVYSSVAVFRAPGMGVAALSSITTSEAPRTRTEGKRDSIYHHHRCESNIWFALK